MEFLFAESKVFESPGAPTLRSDKNNKSTTVKNPRSFTFLLASPRVPKVGPICHSPKKKPIGGMENGRARFYALGTSDSYSFQGVSRLLCPYFELKKSSSQYNH